MSWQIHYLGNFSSAQNIANAAVTVLSSLGYVASYDSEKLVVTVGTETYSCGVASAHSSTNYQTYLLVNDETKEFVIYQNGTTYGYSQSLAKLVNAFLLRGTDVDTGESGLFTLSATSGYIYQNSNPWCINDTSLGRIFLQRAVFLYTSMEHPAICENVFWGTAGYTPGAVITVGDDTFMCLNGILYAKL